MQLTAREERRDVVRSIVVFVQSNSVCGGGLVEGFGLAVGRGEDELVDGGADFGGQVKELSTLIDIVQLDARVFSYEVGLVH